MPENLYPDLLKSLEWSIERKESLCRALFADEITYQNNLFSVKTYLRRIGSGESAFIISCQKQEHVSVVRDLLSTNSCDFEEHSTNSPPFQFSILPGSEEVDRILNKILLGLSKFIPFTTNATLNAVSIEIQR